MYYINATILYVIILYSHIIMYYINATILYVIILY